MRWGSRRDWVRRLNRHLDLEKQIVDDWHAELQLPEMRLDLLSEWVQLCRATRHRIRRCENQWAGETVVCVGNGPSINQMDLRLLDGSFAIGTNRAYQLLDRFTPKQFHLVVQDNHRLKELGSDLARLECPLHVGNIYFDEKGKPADWIDAKKSNLSIYLPRLRWDMTPDSLTPIPDFEPGFSADPTHHVCYGYSIIFSAIQFAAYFGARRVVCIGIDMDYSGATNFAPGVKPTWDGFDYDYHAKPMFNRLREELEARGVELINATPGGRVDAIERMSLAEAMGSSRSQAA